MQTEQKQTHHGGTGEQETEIGSKLSEREKQPEDPDTLDTGSIEDEPVDNNENTVRNPAGDDIGDAVDGDEGSGRRV
jgi:hypothetical protein